jgi:hypothetical protein
LRLGMWQAQSAIRADTARGVTACGAGGLTASVACIQIAMMEDGCVGGKDKPKTVDAPIASAFGPGQDDAHEPEASSVHVRRFTCYETISALSRQHLTWGHDLISIPSRYLPVYTIDNHPFTSRKQKEQQQ